MMNNYDENFLIRLSQRRDRTVYGRIIALNFNEEPLDCVEGRITQGSINVDGNSAIRRTCSLTLIAQNFKYDDYYWGLHTKFRLEVGLKNDIEPKYPEIIWFPQGIYLITTFNTSRTTNNFTIQISGKDKMALLNGEISGSIEGRTDFGVIEEENSEGIWEIRKIPIREIIKNMVHVYAKEPYHNIFINDLDITGLELLQYNYDDPIYLYREVNSNIYKNALQDGNIKCAVYIPEKENPTVPSSLLKICSLNELTGTDIETLLDASFGTTQPKIIKFLNDQGKEENGNYIITKIEYGQTAGYRETELVFAGDLIANPGEAITSVLDKIKKMLGLYEYFYDVHGRFVFQKKPNEATVVLPPFDSEDGDETSYLDFSPTEYAYDFLNTELITSFANNPNLANLRNDYSIWGTRRTVSGVDVPIHLRYAIDKKPTQYTLIAIDYEDERIKEYNEKNGTQLTGQVHYTYTTDNYDWREIIYRMAQDYYRYGHLDDFQHKIIEANGDLYPGGVTGYEQYYLDLYSFWRDLYNPDINTDILKAKIKIIKKQREILSETDPILQKNMLEQYDDLCDKAEELIENAKNYFYYTYDENGNPIFEYQTVPVEGATADDAKLYIAEDLYDKNNNKIIYGRAKRPKLHQGWPLYDEIILHRIYDSENEKQVHRYDNELNSVMRDIYYREVKTIYSTNHLYWNRSVFERPSELSFWFDFLDSSGDLEKYSVKVVGQRPKVINDNNVKSIYYRETPEVIYTSPNDEYTGKTKFSYKYIQAPIDGLLTVSAQGVSAKNKLNDLLYQHSYCVESSTISVAPIYYLQPNTKIYLEDKELGLKGDYLISKLTVPLTYNGLMQITATKTVDRIN